jgi:hypothetical protein
MLSRRGGLPSRKSHTCISSQHREVSIAQQVSVADRRPDGTTGWWSPGGAVRSAPSAESSTTPATQWQGHIKGTRHEGSVSFDPAKHRARCEGRHAPIARMGPTSPDVGGDNRDHRSTPDVPTRSFAREPERRASPPRRVRIPSTSRSLGPMSRGVRGPKRPPARFGPPPSVSARGAEPEGVRPCSACRVVAADRRFRIWVSLRPTAKIRMPPSLIASRRSEEFGLRPLIPTHGRRPVPPIHPRSASTYPARG